MTLNIIGAGKQYRRGDRAFWALRHVDLTLQPGEFVSIVGRSGSGKSTLLSLIAGMQRPTEGEIRLEGKAGYVPQGQSLLANLTVRENILLPHFLSRDRGKSQSVFRQAEEWMKRFGIEELADSYPSQLSGGEHRRAGIVRALIGQPEVLLADEPTADLDLENTQAILDSFRQLSREGMTVLMATHERDALVDSDRVVEIQQGTLVHQW